MSDSGAKGSELGICLRSTPSSPLACFVPSCDFVNPNLDRVKDHIEAVHHTKGAIRFEISFFEQTDADLLASAAVPSAPNTDEDDSMDTDDPANSEELSGMATDEDGYAPGVDESGGLEGEDEEEVSDAPANERLFFMRGRLTKLVFDRLLTLAAQETHVVDNIHEGPQSLPTWGSDSSAFRQPLRVHIHLLWSSLRLWLRWHILVPTPSPPPMMMKALTIWILMLS